MMKSGNSNKMKQKKINKNYQPPRKYKKVK
jgi:hypothetical protein